MAAESEGTVGHRILRSTAGEQEAVDGPYPFPQGSGSAQEGSLGIQLTTPKTSEWLYSPADEAVTRLVVDSS